MSALPHSHSTLHGTGFSFLVDDLSRPMKAACIVPAQCATPAIVNFITKFTSGLFTVALTPSRAASLQIAATPARFTQKDESHVQSLVSVEARHGVTTGISAFDRAKTINVLGDPSATTRDIISPGHIFPVLTREGGILQKISLAEGAIAAARKVHKPRIDLCEAVLFVEAINPQGQYYSLEDLKLYAKHENVPLYTLSELLKETIAVTPLVEHIAQAKLPSSFSADYTAHIFRSKYQEGEHIALVLGTVDPTQPTLVRVQNESTITDVFGGQGSSRDLLRQSLNAIAQRGSGILLYLRKPEAAPMMEQTQAPGPGSEMREYGIGAQILSSLGVKKIELLTQSTKALVGLNTFGLEIVSQTRIVS